MNDLSFITTCTSLPNAGDISGDNVEEEDESTTISLQNASYADGGDGDIIISDAQSSATITVLDDDGENAGKA